MPGHLQTLLCQVTAQSSRIFRFSGHSSRHSLKIPPQGWETVVYRSCGTTISDQFPVFPTSLQSLILDTRDPKAKNSSISHCLQYKNKEVLSSTRHSTPRCRWPPRMLTSAPAHTTVVSILFWTAFSMGYMLLMWTNLGFYQFRTGPVTWGSPSSFLVYLHYLSYSCPSLPDD